MATSLTSRKEKKSPMETEIKSLLTPDRKTSTSTIASTRKKSYKPSKISVTSQDTSFQDSNFILDEAHARIEQLLQEIEHLHKINHELESENETLRNVERFKAKQADLESKIGFLLVENQRLSSIIEQNGGDPSSGNRSSPIFMNIPSELYPTRDEIASLETLRDRLGTEPDNHGNIQEIANENEVLKTRLNEALDYALRLVEENTRLKDAGRESESIQEFVSDNDYVSDEDNRRVKFAKVDPKQLQDLKDQVEDMYQELKKTYEERENFENRFLIKETECENLKKKIEDLERIIHKSPTLDDIEVLKNKVQDAWNQNTTLRNDLQETKTGLEDTLTVADRLRETVAQLETENHNLLENITIKNQENETFVAMIGTLNQENEKLKEELQTKTDDLKKSQIEFTGYKESVPGGEKYIELQTAMKRVSLLAAQLQLENDQIKPKFVDLEEKVKEIPSLQEKIKTFESEHTKLKGQLDIRTVDLDIAKKRNEWLEADSIALGQLKPKVIELNEENVRIGDLITQKNSEIEAKKKKIHVLETELSSAGDKISALNIELDSLGKIIECKNKEIDTYKLAVNHLNVALNESIEIRATCQETKREYERMKQITQEAADQMETLRMKLQEHSYLQGTIVTNVGSQLKALVQNK